MANEKIVTLENLTLYNDKIQAKITGIDDRVSALEIAPKQDVIIDLETIREGAYRGATALQEITKIDSDYTTITLTPKDSNKQAIKVDIKTTAVEDATALKQGFADAYDVKQVIANVKDYVDTMCVWEEFS